MPITAAQIQQAISAILFFKNERSWLDALVINLGELGPDFPPEPVDTGFTYQGGDFISERIAPPFEGFSLNLSGFPIFNECYPTIQAKYNKHYHHSAGITYGALKSNAIFGASTSVPTGATEVQINLGGTPIEDILEDGPFVITAGPAGKTGAYVDQVTPGIAICVKPGSSVPLSPFAAGYNLAISVNWNTNFWFTSHGSGSFSIAFSTPAPAGAVLDWFMPGSETTMTYLANGNQAISAGATSAPITIPSTGGSTAYALTLTPSWNTEVWWDSKASTGFNVNFSVPAPAGATLDWSAVIP
jgi:hypothetical protein